MQWQRTACVNISHTPSLYIGMCVCVCVYISLKREVCCVWERTGLSLIIYAYFLYSERLTCVCKQLWVCVCLYICIFIYYKRIVCANSSSYVCMYIHVVSKLRVWTALPKSTYVARELHVCVYNSVYRESIYAYICIHTARERSIVCGTAQYIDIYAYIWRENSVCLYKQRYLIIYVYMHI